MLEDSDFLPLASGTARNTQSQPSKSEALTFLFSSGIEILVRTQAAPSEEEGVEGRFRLNVAR